MDAKDEVDAALARIHAAMREISDDARTVLRDGDQEQYFAFFTYVTLFLELEMFELRRLSDERFERMLCAQDIEMLIWRSQVDSIAWDEEWEEQEQWDEEEDDDEDGELWKGA